jgi:hypothetical protein
VTSNSDFLLLDNVTLHSSDIAAAWTIPSISIYVAGQVSLDLCSFAFPSEALRVGRVQLLVTTTDGDPVGLSVEAIAYRNDASAQQAMGELVEAGHRCPNRVQPPVVRDQAPERWTFDRSPDTHWATVPGVDRLAFDATLRSRGQRPAHLLLIYLRRGRVLIGIYADVSKDAARTGLSSSKVHAITTAITDHLASGKVE